MENSCDMEVSRVGVKYEGGMKVWEGDVENSCGMEVLGDGVEYSGVMEVSSVEQQETRPPCSPTRPSRRRPLPLSQPRIGCILTVVDDARGLMDGPCDVDASSSCATMRWSFPIRRKTDIAM